MRLGAVLGVDTHVVPAGRRHVPTNEARWIPLAEVVGLPRVGLVDIALEMWSANRA